MNPEIQLAPVYVQEDERPVGAPAGEKMGVSKGDPRRDGMGLGLGVGVGSILKEMLINARKDARRLDRSSYGGQETDPERGKKDGKTRKVK